MRLTGRSHRRWLSASAPQVDTHTLRCQVCQLGPNARQVGVQLIGLLVVAAYSGLATALLIKLVNAVARVRSSQRDEAVGLDVTQHGEEAYTRGDGAVLVMPSITAADTRSTDESMRVPLEVPA